MERAQWVVCKAYVTCSFHTHYYQSHAYMSQQTLHCVPSVSLLSSNLQSG